MMTAMTTLIAEGLGGGTKPPPTPVQRSYSAADVVVKNDNIEDQDWKKALLDQSGLDENKAKTISLAKEQWRANALDKLPSKDHHWKMTYIMEKCINSKQAMAMVEAEASDKAKVEALAKVSKETLWKISYLNRADMDSEDIDFYDKCDDEDLAEIFSNLTKQWKKDLMIKHAAADLTVWKADCLKSSNCQWQGQALMRSKYEAQAQLIHNCTETSFAEAILKIPKSQIWKLKMLKKCDHDWQVQMIINVENEEKARYISETNMEGIGTLIMESEDLWKCKAMAQINSLWAAQVLSRVKHQWQGKIVTDGVTSDMDRYRIQQVPDLDDETLATQYLFSSRHEMPIWLFELGIKMAKNDSASPHQKMEKVLSMMTDLKQWKVELIVNLTQDNMWKIEFIPDIVCKEIAEEAERCVTQEHWLLTSKCEKVWQAKMLADTPEEWKQTYLSKSGYEKLEKWKAEMYLSQSDERKCKLISLCTQKWQAEMVNQEPQEWKCRLLATTPEQWRAEYIQKAKEEWRANLMAKGADKVNRTNTDDQWRYQLMLDTPEEWKAIAISEVPEMWRAEMIARESLEWKVNLITEGRATDRRDERWRLKLIEPLTKEWQVKMVLASNSVWKAELIAKLGEDEERRGTELIQCTTEKFAAIVMDGYLDTLYN